MSLRPGIGADFMHEVASEFLHYESSFNASQPDVPSALRVGARSQPLGRYLRKRLRVLVGRDERAPQEAIYEYQKEVLPLLEAAKADPDNPSLRGQIVARYSQQILNMKSKQKLWNKGRRKL